MPTADDFREYIISKIRNSPLDWIDLTSGDIHRELGGYPGSNHRMPTCCSVMYQLMSGDDTVLPSTRVRKGASVSVRYFKHNHI